MNFAGDRGTSSWAHVAFCADPTWTGEPPDEFVVANQRLWTRHCHLSQWLRTNPDKSNAQCELPEKQSCSTSNTKHGGRLSVKDVIPESRLAKYYGNFYYDELRERCYSNSNEDYSRRSYNGISGTSSDPTECWMLPEFQFNTPQPQWGQYKNQILTSSTPLTKSSAPRPPYRGTNISRYTPTTQRPHRSSEKRNGVWWQKNNSPRVNQKIVETKNDDNQITPKDLAKTDKVETKTIELEEKYEDKEDIIKKDLSNENLEVKEAEESQSPEVIATDEQLIVENIPPDLALIKKRLYSTVLSTQPITLSNIKLPTKPLIPGLLKLNPNIVLPSDRLKNITENKFEELEKEALEQYKASDESIDTKFSNLEKQAVEQYSTSNSNTSCSSGNSTEKAKKFNQKTKRKDKVNSLVIYSNNYPDFKGKGARKEQSRRSNKAQRNLKKDYQKNVSDHEPKERKGNKNRES